MSRRSCLLLRAKEANRQWLPSLTHRPQMDHSDQHRSHSGAGLHRQVDISYDHNLLHMQDRNLESVRWQEKLIEGNTGASWYAISYTNNTPEEARRLKAKFEELPEVSKVDGVCRADPGRAGAQAGKAAGHPEKPASACRVFTNGPKISPPWLSVRNP